MPDEYDNEENIILTDLPDDDLVEQMHDDIYDGLAEEIAEGTQILLDRGWSANAVLEKALVGGMAVVGVDFRDGILFVPEVLMSANAMKAGMEILKPILSASGAEPIGKVVVGTVKGDIHDIGKNLVGMMLEGAGFEVVDLGVGVKPEQFVEKAVEEKADIIGVSALLTTTMMSMAEVVKLKNEKGLSSLKVIIGGAPLSLDFCKEIGADAYGVDAMDAVVRVKELMGL